MVGVVSSIPSGGNFIFADFETPRCQFCRKLPEMSDLCYLGKTRVHRQLMQAGCRLKFGGDSVTIFEHCFVKQIVATGPRLVQINRGVSDVHTLHMEHDRDQVVGK